MKTNSIMFRIFFALLSFTSYGQGNFVGQITYQTRTNSTDTTIDAALRQIGASGNIMVQLTTDGQTVLLTTIFFGGVKGNKFTLGHTPDTSFSAQVDYPAYQDCIQAKTKNYTDPSIDSLKMIAINTRCIEENTELETSTSEYESDTQDEPAQFFEEYRNILGYRCQKAIVTDETGAKTLIYFTKSLPPVVSRDKGWKQIKGLVMYREIKAPFGGVTRLQASEISLRPPTKMELTIRS